MKINSWTLAGLIVITTSVGYFIVNSLGPEIQDHEISARQSDLAKSVSNSFESSTNDSDSSTISLKPVSGVAANGQVFATMAISRFGEGWQRLVAEGTVWEPSLNVYGIGHYRGTEYPGEVGNFAVAGHRGGFGGTFREIHKLVPGDTAVVTTTDSIFTYRFLETVIVKPEAVGVLADLPEGLSTAVEGGKYLTITSCDPIWVNTNRIVAWFELVNVSPVN